MIPMHPGSRGGNDEQTDFRTRPHLLLIVMLHDPSTWPCQNPASSAKAKRLCTRCNGADYFIFSFSKTAFWQPPMKRAVNIATEANRGQWASHYINYRPAIAIMSSGRHSPYFPARPPRLIACCQSLGGPQINERRHHGRRVSLNLPK